MTTQQATAILRKNGYRKVQYAQIRTIHGSTTQRIEGYLMRVIGGKVCIDCAYYEDWHEQSVSIAALFAGSVIVNGIVVIGQ